MRLSLYITTLFLILVIGCSTCQQKSKKEQLMEDIERADTTLQKHFPKKTMGDVIRSVPSPLELSVLLKKTGVKFNSAFLHNADQYTNYNTNFQKALNLGVYGTDLGYANIYQQTQTSIQYLDVVKELADDLHVGQFFDLNTIRRLARNRENSDSILYITTRGFNEMDDYLRNHQRGHLSVLILTGGWLEAFYIATQVAKETPGQSLKKRIGEQKPILNDVIKLLEVYDKNKKFAKLKKEFRELREVYKDVSTTYEKGERKKTVKDGVLMVNDQSSSTVTITNKELQNIIEKTVAVRQQVIQ